MIFILSYFLIIEEIFFPGERFLVLSPPGPLAILALLERRFSAALHGRNARGSTLQPGVSP
jgi:hypothetical protein